MDSIYFMSLDGNILIEKNYKENSKREIVN
jgi:hypothetical protein